jgi:hypothetical protein
MAALAAGFYALLGEAAAAAFKGEAQKLVVHWVPPPPSAGTAR